MKKPLQFRKLWQKIVAFSVGVPVVLAALYGSWGLLHKVDTRWEKAEAAAEQKKATEQQFQDIRQILQLGTLRELKKERDFLLDEQRKRKLTKYEEDKLRDLLDQIKRLEDALKK